MRPRPSNRDAANFYQRDDASRVPCKLRTKRPQKPRRRRSEGSSTNISRSACAWRWAFLASRIIILRLSVPVATRFSTSLRASSGEVGTKNASSFYVFTSCATTSRQRTSGPSFIHVKPQRPSPRPPPALRHKNLFPHYSVFHERTLLLSCTWTRRAGRCSPASSSWTDSAEFPCSCNSSSSLT